MQTLTIKSEKSAKFYICQYLSDPFRQEPRNIGVIVQSQSGVGCRFKGESEDGQIDGRSLRAFAEPDNYRNWVHFWRRTVEKRSATLERALMRANRGTFRAVDGGHLGDTGDDSIGQMVQFLFSTLVAEDDFDHAIGEDPPERKSSPHLATEVARAFRQNELTEPFQRSNAIYRNRDLIGKSRPHRFEFVQLNGKYVPMEVFDFRRGSKRAIDHHVGWANYAFNDVVAAETKPTFPHSIVVPPDAESDRSHKESFEFAMESLGKTSRVIRWDTSKEDFLRERREMADGIN